MIVNYGVKQDTELKTGNVIIEVFERGNDPLNENIKKFVAVSTDGLYIGYGDSITEALLEASGSLETQLP